MSLKPVKKALVSWKDEYKFCVCKVIYDVKFSETSFDLKQSSAGRCLFFFSYLLYITFVMNVDFKSWVSASFAAEVKKAELVDDNIKGSFPFECIFRYFPLLPTTPLRLLICRGPRDKSTNKLHKVVCNIFN